MFMKCTLTNGQYSPLQEVLTRGDMVQKKLLVFFLKKETSASLQPFQVVNRQMHDTDREKSCVRGKLLWQPPLWSTHSVNSYCV